MPDAPHIHRHPGRLFRFGIFELDGATGELRRDGKARPRLQGQPLALLLELLDRPGDVVTREELRKRLWPADTFVDYDHSLNTAVNKLREALNDSAESPRFIQTLPRRGYRFIAPVEKAQHRTALVSAPDSGSEAGPAESAEPPTAVLSDARELPPVPRMAVRVLFSLIQLLYLGLYVAVLGSLDRMESVLAQAVSQPVWLFVPLILTAAVGIPVRLYLLSASLFGYQRLTARFRRLFLFLFPLDELWALVPFLFLGRSSFGLALAATAGLVYLPFSQRSLLLMGDAANRPRMRER